jgi:hypothetical protein
VDAFFSSIESGVVLCQLMNKVNDKIPCKFQVPKADAKNAQFIARYACDVGPFVTLSHRASFDSTPQRQPGQLHRCRQGQ